MEQELVAIEKGLWTNDAPLDRDSLIRDALLVFPETGVITRDRPSGDPQENERGADGPKSGLTMSVA